MFGFDGATGHFGKPPHLVTDYPPTARAVREIGEGLEGAEHARDDRDIALGAPTGLIEGASSSSAKTSEC